MTSRVSWEAGMKGLPTHPRPTTHTHGPRQLGRRDARLQRAWNLGSCCTFLAFLPTINTSITWTTASILDACHHGNRPATQAHAHALHPITSRLFPANLNPAAAY